MWLVAQLCYFYHWTLEYVMEGLTLGQALLMWRMAFVLQGEVDPALADQPDRKALYDHFGRVIKKV